MNKKGLMVSVFVLSLGLTACGSDSQPDADNDGIADAVDNCLNIANDNQLNTDATFENGDVLGDACDDDDDADGVLDTLDALPLNPSESKDTDQDTIGDNADNCLYTVNLDQLNNDGDSAGNACDAFVDDATEIKDFDGDGFGDNLDPDDDNDSYADDIDVYPFDKTEWADNDGDNIGDNNDLDLASNNPNSIQLNRLQETGRLTKFIGEYGVDDDRFAYLGRMVRNIGDVNGDKLDDLFIGHHGLRIDGIAPGIGYLLFGQENGWPEVVDLADLTNIPHILFKPDLTNEMHGEMGAGVIPMGDLNGDGIDDFMLSASAAFDEGAAFGEDNGFVAGEVYLIFGRSSWLTDSGEDLTITTEELHTNFAITFKGQKEFGLLGTSLENLGDINGDGLSDVAISEGIEANYSHKYGKIHILFGNSNWSPEQIGTVFNIDAINNDAGLKHVEITSRSYFLGALLKPIGDFNDDGLNDFAFSDYAGEGLSHPRMAVFFGRPTESWTNEINVDNLQGGQGFLFKNPDERSSLPVGQSSIASGDLNGDGIPDLITSTLGKLSRDEDGTYNKSGLVHILWGGRGSWPLNIIRNNLTSFYGVTIAGETVDLNLGTELAVVPDWDGDGFNELLVSAGDFQSVGESAPDTIYRINGKQIWENSFMGPGDEYASTERIIFESAYNNDKQYINVLGDLNGDGLSEVTFSSVLEDSNGLTNNGEFYLLYGYKSLYPTMVTPAETEL